MNRNLIPLAALAAVLVACAPTPPPSPTPFVVGPPPPVAATCPEPGRRLIVTGQPEAVVAVFGEILLSVPEIGMVVVCAPDAAGAASIYSAMDGVEEDRLMSIPEGEDAPAEASVLGEPVAAPFTEPMEAQQWAVPNLRLLDAHQRAMGDGVLVAVIDTGVDCSHPDYVCGGDIDLIGSGSRNMHATHVAGIVAALRNQVGVLGTAPAAKILSVRVLDTNGSGNMSVIAQGIVKAADAGAKVLNLSLGGPGTSSTMAQAVQYAISRGAVVIAAAGNSNSGSPFSPACEPGVLAVGAIDQNNQKASFSNFGACVRIAAPGVSILSTLPNNQYGSLSGTSMASPFVAGVAALVAGQGIAPSDIIPALISSGRAGPSNLGGKLLAADQAVNAQPGPTLPPAPFPTTRPTSPAIATEVPGPTAIPPSLCVEEVFTRNGLRKVFAPCGQ